jgi:hypothetical protein
VNERADNRAAAPAQARDPAARGTEGSAAVERRLRQVWRKDRRVAHLRGFCLLVAWTATLFLLTLFIDWWLLLPGFGRVALWVLNLGALAAVAFRGWWVRLERYDPVRVALRVERRHPDLESRIVSDVQFHRGRGFAGSAALRAALHAETEERSRAMDFRDIVDARALRRLARYSLAVVAVFAAVSLAWNEAVRVMARRMLNPAASIPYPTRTRIVEVTGERRIRQGDAVRIEAVAEGRIPPDAVLLLRVPGGEPEPVTVTRTGEDRYVYEQRQVLQDFDYAFRIGDASSAWYRVHASRPPTPVRTRVSLRYPAYLERPDAEVDRLNLDVPEGTEITWLIEHDRPVGEAAFHVGAADPEEEDAEEAMAIEDDGRTIRFTRRADASFHYRITRAWSDGPVRHVADDPVRHMVRAVPDRPPWVDLVAPRRDQPATVRKRLDIAFRAGDDHGVDEAWVVFRRNQDEEQRLRIGRFSGTDIEGSQVWRPRESLPDIAEGDVIEFAVEVSDRRNGAREAQRGRSASRRIFVLSDAQYLRHIMEERRQLMTGVGFLVEEEKEALDEVGDLKDATVGPGETEP